MTIVWSLFAISDREAIFDYIEADSPPAAVRIDEQIEGQVEGLMATPEIGRPGRIVGTRELVIQRTPYIAAYRIEGRTREGIARAAWSPAVAGRVAGGLNSKKHSCTGDGDKMLEMEAL